MSESVTEAQVVEAFVVPLVVWVAPFGELLIQFSSCVKKKEKRKKKTNQRRQGCDDDGGRSRAFGHYHSAHKGLHQHGDDRALQKRQR